MGGVEEDVESMKRRLASYNGADIRFNEPHFSQQLALRDGSRDDVIKNLLNPDNLVHYYTETGRMGDTKHSLYFRISNTKTMKIPVIFDIKGRKSILVLTYIMRYRPWQTMLTQSPR
jgi:hypothetical protein